MRLLAKEKELEEMKEKAIREGRDPLYEGRWKDFSLDEAKKKVDAGEKAVIRFRLTTVVTSIDVC